MRWVLLNLGYWNISVRGAEHLAEAYRRQGKAVVVFNHISWVDSLLLACFVDSCGVAKESLKSTPLCGR